MTVVFGCNSLDLGLEVVTRCFEWQQGWENLLGEDEDKMKNRSGIASRSSDKWVFWADVQVLITSRNHGAYHYSVVTWLGHQVGEVGRGGMVHAGTLTTSGKRTEQGG